MYTIPSPTTVLLTYKRNNLISMLEEQKQHKFSTSSANTFTKMFQPYSHYVTELLLMFTHY